MPKNRADTSSGPPINIHNRADQGSDLPLQTAVDGRVVKDLAAPVLKTLAQKIERETVRVVRQIMRAARPHKYKRPRLIFDIGMNHGEDTEFYLAKGFRVVGVEANPQIASELRLRFEREIADGRLTLIAKGIWHEPGSIPFYKNLSNDHWSSFDPKYGCRDGTPYEVLEVSTMTIGDLIERFGTPYFMKIDVEGADKTILSDLRRIASIPAYLSVEEYGFRAIDDLFAVGYREFQTLPQGNKAWAAISASEGPAVERRFDGRDSGTFGQELPANWLPYQEARHLFVTTVRSEAHEHLGDCGEWYDIHARRPPA